MEITANWRISVNKRSVASHHFTMVGCLSGTFTKDAIGWTVIETYGARSYIMRSYEYCRILLLKMSK